MFNKLTIKLITIAIITLVFSFVLLKINFIIDDRQELAQGVAKEIQSQQVSAQTIITPFIKVPLLKNCSEITAAWDDSTKDAPQHIRSKKYDCDKKPTYLIATPSEINWDNQKVQVENDKYKRGIYNIISYQNNMEIAGKFVFTDVEIPEYTTADWSKAKLVLPISDTRGINQNPILEISNKKISMEMAKKDAQLENYSFLSIVNINPAIALDFKLNAQFEGTRSLRMIPLGNEFQAKMQANWPDPKFYGNGLPQKRSIDNTQFSAEWNTIVLSQQNNQNLEQCLRDNGLSACDASSFNFFAVEMIEKINIYSLTDRSIKYGLLFIFVTFASFFLFESLKNLSIHPIQYILVGSAQAVFYLLLLSFSEHIGFALAYLVASSACILIICYYVSYILNSWQRTISLGVILSIMYISMYLLLHTSDYTLILGSVLVFTIIAIIMVSTRKFDWYSLSTSTKKNHNRREKIVDLDFENINNKNKK